MLKEVLQAQLQHWQPAPIAIAPHLLEVIPRSVAMRTQGRAGRAT
jgi:hypothetical protein